MDNQLADIMPVRYMCLKCGPRNCPGYFMRFGAKKDAPECSECDCPEQCHVMLLFTKATSTADWQCTVAGSQLTSSAPRNDRTVLSSNNSGMRTCQSKTEVIEGIKSRQSQAEDARFQAKSQFAGLKRKLESSASSKTSEPSASSKAPFKSFFLVVVVSDSPMTNSTEVTTSMQDGNGCLLEITGASFHVGEVIWKNILKLGRFRQ
jgi:hypothetical protein